MVVNTRFRTFYYLSALIFFGLCLASGASADSVGRQVITGHVPKDVFISTKLDRLPANKVLHISVGLPQRNKSEFAELSKNLQDPFCPEYHHFLTTEELTERFGPTEHDYQAVIDFLKSKGFRVTYTSKTRLLVGFMGKAGDIEKLFHLHFYNYKRSNGTVFYAPDREPSVDLEVPLLHIAGLDNHFIFSPLNQIQKREPN